MSPNSTVRESGPDLGPSSGPSLTTGVAGTGTARDSGVPSDQLVGPNAMLRLLDQRPDAADGVAATSGVKLCGHWAEAAAEVLKH